MANSYATLSLSDRRLMQLPTDIVSVHVDHYDDSLSVKVQTKDDNIFLHGYFVSAEVVDVNTNIFDLRSSSAPRTVSFTTSKDWLVAYIDNAHNIALRHNNK